MCVFRSVHPKKQGHGAVIPILAESERKIYQVELHVVVVVVLLFNNLMPIELHIQYSPWSKPEKHHIQNQCPYFCLPFLLWIYHWIICQALLLAFPLGTGNLGLGGHLRFSKPQLGSGAKKIYFSVFSLPFSLNLYNNSLQVTLIQCQSHTYAWRHCECSDVLMLENRIQSSLRKYLR